MNVTSMTERQLVNHLDAFASQLDLKVIGREVKIGAYRLDAVAQDSSGALVVIEFKANASITALSQLLLYPNALTKVLKEEGITPPPIRSLLITTHLDTCVVEVAQQLASSVQIDALVCVSGHGGRVDLVTAEEAGVQAWDQSARGSHCLDSIVENLRE